MDEQLPIFHWCGRDINGQIINGNIQGASRNAVRASLQLQGIHSVYVYKKPLYLSHLNNLIRLFNKTTIKKITTKQLVIFTRQLATLLKANIPIIQALNIIAKGSNNVSLISLINKIKISIEEGYTLSEALCDYPHYFNQLYCDLIAIGEQSGTLDNIVGQLADQLEYNQKLKSKIRKALLYPVIVIIVSFVITLAMLLFVIPQFETLFHNFGQELPLLTQIIVTISKNVRKFFWLILATIPLYYGYSIFAKYYPQRVAMLRDDIFLRLPIFGSLIKKAAIARFAHTLAITFAAGIPLLSALPLVIKTLDNQVLISSLSQVVIEINSGQSLHTSMQSSTFFPTMMLQLVSIGEESGYLEQMLIKVATIYSEEVSNTLDNLENLLEPLMMIILGIIVGGIVLALYLPILQLGNLL